MRAGKEREGDQNKSLLATTVLLLTAGSVSPG